MITLSKNTKILLYYGILWPWYMPPHNLENCGGESVKVLPISIVLKLQHDRWEVHASTSEGSWECCWSVCSLCQIIFRSAGWTRAQNTVRLDVEGHILLGLHLLSEQKKLTGLLILCLVCVYNRVLKMQNCIASLSIPTGKVQERPRSLEQGVQLCAKGYFIVFILMANNFYLCRFWCPDRIHCLYHFLLGNIFFILLLSSLNRLPLSW